MTGLDPNPASVTIPPQASPAGLAPAASAAPAQQFSAALAQQITARLPRDPRARLAALFDPGTLELLPAEGEERSGALAGVGLVQGAGVVAFASDPRVQGGAMGTAGCAANVGVYAEAMSRGVPIVGLCHSGGARLAEGVASLHAVGTVFAAMTAASGRVP